MTKRGPKPPPDPSPLPFAATGDDVADFARFASTYLLVEGGTAMTLRSWQRDIVAMVWGDPRPKLSALAIGRGNSKSTLLAGMCLYLAFLRDEYSIDLLAFDERQASIIGRICAKFIARHPELDRRAQIYRDRIVVGRSELCWLPAIAAALEGRLPDFVAVDEGGRVDREVYEVAAFSVSKKAHAQLFLIGTPGPDPSNVLAEFRAHCASHPEDTTQAYKEFSADPWRDHPADCDDHDGGPGCLTAANPALGDWLDRASVLATLPPKMTEQHWRRVRLVQFWATGAEDPFIPATVWDSLSTGAPIPAGTRVVLGLDGSFGGKDSDTTALVVATVSPKPHVDVVRVWANTDNTPTWRVPILEVEQAVRDACQYWDVAEFALDPFRFGRTAVVLSDDVTTVEFPWSPSRVTRATVDLRNAILNGELTHSGDATLRAHVMAATVVEHDGALKISKTSRRRSAQPIDCLAAMLMCHSRATWIASKKSKRARVIGVR